MKSRTQLIASAFTLALTGQVSILHAQPMSEPQDPSIVDVLSNGFFAQPSMDANLVVMNVRVFNDANELVLSERVLEHSVQLLAAGLPDGKYHYEVVSVYELAKPVGEGADREEFSTQRNFGNFEVRAGAIAVPHEGEFHDPDNPDFSLLDQLSDDAIAVAGRMLSLLIPTAQAADLTITDSDPDLFFQDTSGGASAFGEWTIQGTTTEFQIRDQENNNLEPIIEIIPGTGHADSILIDSDGDIHWANGGMNFDRSSQSLGIGGTQTQVDMYISNGTPDIRLNDESGTQQAEWELSGNTVRFYGRPNNAASWNDPINYQVTSPSDSLVIDSAGEVGFGTASPARQLHITGPNAVFRMDRSKDTASFMLVRNNGGSIWKTYVVGTNASGANNGEFVINDLGTAVSGPGNNRMTINNSGNVHFPGVVTASNIAAPSSRALKENIDAIPDPLDLTLRLDGVRFNWKDSGQPALGFIAEDIEQVLPEVVLHDEGSGKMLGVNYTAVVPVLVEAIKAQQQEIVALQEQLAAFQDQDARLARLEALVVGNSLEATLARN